MDELVKFFVGKAVELDNNEIFMVMGSIDNKLILQKNGFKSAPAKIKNVISKLNRKGITYQGFVEQFPEYLV